MTRAWIYSNAIHKGRTNRPYSLKGAKMFVIYAKNNRFFYKEVKVKPCETLYINAISAEEV